MISRENIQAIYPLMQKQRALAYYSLQPERVDPGFIQLRLLIKGPLDEQAFRRAWQVLLGRHESLRISLQSPKNKQSMLVVLKSCVLPLEWVDLRKERQEAQEHYIADWLEHTRKQGFDLANAPAHRLLGVRTDDQVVEFFWACHHLFLDGWSAIVLLNDLAQIYSNDRSGLVLAEPAKSTHADYLKWLSGRSPESAAQFWRARLAGYNKPVFFSEHFGGQLIGAGNYSREHNEHIVSATAELGAAIDHASAQLKVTSATVVYAVWAIYLGTITQSDDVVFGTTTAGRAFDLPDSHLMTGYFANVIPKRHQLSRSQSLDEFISRSHQDSFSALPFEYVTVDDIQSYAGNACGQPLFDNLVLFENLSQKDIDMHDQDGIVTMGTFSGGLTSTYPLTLSIRPHGQWRFKYIYATRLRDSRLHPTLDAFPDFLLQICLDTKASVGQACDLISQRVANPTIEQHEPVNVPAEASSSIQLARNATELAVAAIWEKLLGISDIDVHAEFIELGGRSIAAIRMLSEIEDTLGKKLSMLDLVRQPTVAAIARHLDGKSERSHWQSLIPLKPGGSRPPVIFVHAVGTHALFMRSVTRYFDEDQPVLGLQLVGLDGECEPMNSITAISQHYLEEILSYQPEGPYYFVAHCLGAVVAHDMIRRLQEQGKEVALFVVLDACPPLAKPIDPIVKQFMSSLRNTGDTAAVIHCVGVAKQVAENVIYRLGGLATRLRQRYSLSYGTAMARKQVYMELVHAASQSGFYSYIGKPIDQKVVLISSEWKANPTHMAWQDMASELEVVTLPLGHETMFTEPEVAILGKNLSRLVSQSTCSGHEAAMFTNPS